MNRPLLIVEDSPEDREAIIRAIRKAEFTSPIHCCVNGDEAIDYLFHRGKYADASSSPRPSLILLDLILPGTEGHEVLAEIKKTDELKAIPVIILTTSGDNRDIEACYRLGANSYIKKSVGLEDFNRSIQQLKAFWFETAILPK